MAASYPNSIKSFTTRTNGDNIEASIVNDIQDEVNAIETTLGVNAGKWTDWTPGYYGWTALPTGVYRYCRVGKLVIVSVQMVSGQSNATSASLDLPIKSKNTGANTYGTSIIVMDSGAQLATPGGWAVLNDSTLLYFWKDCAGALWTPSGEKLVNGTIIYEAA